MFINIDNGVLEANDLNILSKFGGYITLTEDWARGISQSIDWVKRKDMSPGKYTFNLKEGVKNVPINGAVDKREITTTFADNATGNCFPMQLIYTGKIKKCLPNVEFPRYVHRKPLVKSIEDY